eukprot:s3161_g4.t2
MPEHVIGFGELSPGVPALPFVPALAAAAEDHFSFVTGESAEAARRMCLVLALLVWSSLSRASCSGAGPTSKAKAKAAAFNPLTELDPAVVSAAKAAGL